MGKFDVKKLNEQLERLSNAGRIEWTTRIVNTKMPVLAVKTAVLKQIVKNFKKDEIECYLKSESFCYYENTIIYAKLMTKTNDFELLKNYLFSYIPFVDNWASCDSIEFSFKESEFENYFTLSTQLVEDKREFARRIGIRILFKMVDNNVWLPKIFSLLAKLKDEQAYYVNMAIAWLLCDCFIKQRDATLEFLKNENVSQWVLRKTISKCCDSFRVSNEDKTYLKSLLN